MADPLSIAASVTALIAAARGIYTTLAAFTASVAEAPAVVRNTLAEVLQVRSALVEIERLMSDIATLPPARCAMVRLDHIAVTFSETVLVLTELEAVVMGVDGKGLTAGDPIIKKLRWGLSDREKKLARIFPRLEAQKSCLTLMISILNR